MKFLYSCSALSFAYPYFCCRRAMSFSCFPSAWVRSSSVSLPHFSLTPPLISFHFPFRISSFMFALLSPCSLKHACPVAIHLLFRHGPPAEWHLRNYPAEKPLVISGRYAGRT